ncbi:MAG: xanthine dehydrogenase small subunit [Pseudomonadota bacterium]
MREEVRFLLDGKLVQLRNVAPTRTVLEYLREDLVRTGSKEGCAEGDCGACMVVVADLHEGELRYLAINSCIQFLATLDGKALITVESLSRDGVLHPAQQMMIEQHGSQCGFCTPGFVMTLFALHESTDAPPTPTEVDDALAGNLCRCTGYRPIIDAALSMHGADSAWSPPWGTDQGLREQLTDLADGESLTTGDAHASFLAPRSSDELASLYADNPEATLVAGGTDVGLWVTKQYRDLSSVISIGSVPELRVLAVDDSCIHAGAAVTFSELMPVLLEHYPSLDALMRRWASPPIRNAATIGGNIANGSPIGDSMPPLMAIGTTVALRKGNARRELPLENLYHDYMKNDLAPGEFVESIKIPLPVPSQTVAAYKISKRFDQDISAVCMGISVHVTDRKMHDVRVALGGMAGTVQRAKGCEAALENQLIDKRIFESAAEALVQDFTPMTDMRATADYRTQVASNLIRRFGRSLAEPNEPLEVYSHGR